ncbi:MAG TPA: hypothetical protein VH008_21820 [Pseudonocardia sp.]|nr:hypothetical protein [Pseudonocardia sp.]
MCCAAPWSTRPPAGGEPLDAVADYERRMRGYANEALRRSTRNARAAATESRLSRFAFRTALRGAAAGSRLAGKPRR